MGNNRHDMESYRVTYKIHGISFEDDKTEMTVEETVKVSFSYDDEDYGNGYYMAVKGKCEPFGISVYDIRYETDFNPDEKMAYIVSCYQSRYPGRGRKWKLLSISIEEL